jgi:hypothetical protein
MKVYLPLLTDSSNQVKMLVCQMLGSSTRHATYRRCISSWIPPDHRLHETQTNRGWEKSASITPHSTIRPGGWTITTLCDLINSKESKVRFFLALEVADCLLGQ